MSTRPDMLMKFLIVGDSGVGKTCILFRFANDSFNSAFISTIGIDFRIKTLELQDRKIKLQIWDISGNRKFHDYSLCHYQGATGILLVYDVTDEESFLNIHNWVQTIKEVADPDVKKIIVGNKCDIGYKRRISKVQGENLANENNAKFLETSARLGTNISKAFITLAEDCLAEPEAKEESVLPITVSSSTGKNTIGESIVD